MEIRDSIHGTIRIEPLEVSIINSPHFQRLRQIRQLGFAENSFPGATHHRFIHSLGAMHMASKMVDSIFVRNKKRHTDCQLHADGIARFRQCVRLAALLHDVGHGPLSHSSEFAMPSVRELKLPEACPQGRPLSNLKASHEDYSLKMILDSELTKAIEKAGGSFGIKPIHVASLIHPGIIPDDSFFYEASRELGEVDFRPILSQIISSELDADRMDYLTRDSLFAGVSYGRFDLDWLMGHLTCHTLQSKCYLCLEHRALYAFEDFLISRFHMFLMVYFHHKSVIYEEMLARYLKSEDCDFALPAAIEDYIQVNDVQLFANLAKSKNPWAQRIADRNPYKMFIELHSNIPHHPGTAQAHSDLLQEIRSDLENKKIPYLLSTSTSELSKYFGRAQNPIFVRYDNSYSEPTFLPVEHCTDLYERFSEKRAVTRLYVPAEATIRSST